MSKVKATRYVKHDGIQYQVGDVITMSEEQAVSFRQCGYGVKCDDLEVEESNPIETDDLMRIDGMVEELEDGLIDAGFKTLKSIADASVKDLVVVDGVGKKTANKFIDSAELLLKD